MSESVTVHRWTQDGQEWVCAAYDHGPFCRLCQPVDDVIAACLENVDLGFMEIVGHDPDGQLRLGMTEAGNARVRTLIQELTE
jgi:hypothetical protein